MKTTPETENVNPESNSTPSKPKQGWFRRTWSNIEPTFRVILLISALMVFFFGAYQLHKWRTEVNTMRFLEPYLETDKIISNRINDLNRDRALTEQEKLSTLKVQYKILTERKDHHRELAGFFVSNYYASILIVLFASVGGGIIIFVIASKGWARTHAYIKAVFFVLCFMAVFFAVFPNVFSQRGNFENNLEAFLQYDNLQTEIFNFMTTRQEFNRYGSATDSMITYVNKEIIRLNNIHISNGNNRFEQANEMRRKVNSLIDRPDKIDAIPFDSLSTEGEESFR